MKMKEGGLKQPRKCRAVKEKTRIKESMTNDKGGRLVPAGSAVYIRTAELWVQALGGRYHPLLPVSERGGVQPHTETGSVVCSMC